MLLQREYECIAQSLIVESSLFDKVFAAYPESLHSSLLALLEKFNILFYVDQSNDSATLPSSSSEEKTADCIEGLAAVEETAHREKKLEKGKMERKIIIPSLLPDERVRSWQRIIVCT